MCADEVMDYYKQAAQPTGRAVDRGLTTLPPTLSRKRTERESTGDMFRR